MWPMVVIRGKKTIMIVHMVACPFSTSGNPFTNKKNPNSEVVPTPKVVVVTPRMAAV